MSVLVACGEDRVAVNLRSDQVFKDADARDLARAAAKGDLQQVDDLIARGVDVDQPGQHGITPLWWAMVSYNYAGAERLLDHGADPNVAIGGGWGSIVGWAARAEDSRFLETILQAGGDPDIVGPHGETPLFVAVRLQRIHNIELLIDAGADLDKPRDTGATPALDAAGFSYYDLTYLLLSHGADPLAEDRWGYSLRSTIESRPHHADDPDVQRIAQLVRQAEAAKGAPQNQQPSPEHTGEPQ